MMFGSAPKETEFSVLFRHQPGKVAFYWTISESAPKEPHASYLRGRAIRVVVHNLEHVCRGVVRMTIDRKEVDGNLLPLDLEGPDHDVEVWLGN